MMDEEEGPSRIPVNLEGYNQTYLVEALEPPSRDAKDAEDEIDDEDAVHEHRVLFRCGNWCYTGHVAFDKRRIVLSDIPRAIPMLQRQQNRLHYYCNAKSVPLDTMSDAQAFAGAELASEHVEAELAKWVQ